MQTSKIIGHCIVIRIKSLEEIFNSSKCNTAIEKMQELNLGRLIEEDCKITVTSPAHNKKIVSAVRTKGSKTVEAVITFGTATGW